MNVKKKQPKNNIEITAVLKQENLDCNEFKHGLAEQ